MKKILEESAFHLHPTTYFHTDFRMGWFQRITKKMPRPKFLSVKLFSKRYNIFTQSIRDNAKSSQYWRITDLWTPTPNILSLWWFRKETKNFAADLHCCYDVYQHSTYSLYAGSHSAYKWNVLIGCESSELRSIRWRIKSFKIVAILRHLLPFWYRFFLCAIRVYSCAINTYIVQSIYPE